jgi:hypothetical protein
MGLRISNGTLVALKIKWHTLPKLDVRRLTNIED